MSIKYLQDQQLNQVQQSPIDSPWAKLVAQSELLERNKMRQPQGQAPQGTVAGNIQQQLAAAQQQESEKQNVDLQKAQLLAQLIGSGHLPASFAAQGYADGGLTQPSMQPGTGAYRGIMMPNQPPQMQGQFRGYTPPNSQDPAAQEKKHGMLQSMLDNSIVGMAQGKANIGNAMQDYADLFSGKIFSRGFAEGGDLYAFDNSTGTRAQQLARMRANLAAGYNPYMPDEGGETRAQQLARMKAGLSAQDLANEPFRRAAEARAAKLRAIQEQAAGAQRALPAPGPTSTSSLESVLGKNANIQDFINSLKSKQLATTGAPASASPEGVENLPAVRTGTGLPVETNYGRGATVDAPYFVHPNATPNADAAAKSAWESANILDRANSKWDRGQSPEAKAWLASQQQANAPVEGKPPVPYDPMAPGATTLEEVAAKAKQGLGSLGEAAKVVGRPIAKVAGALSPIGDLMMANKFTGGSNALLAQALSGQTPSGSMQGDIPEVAKDLMTAPSVPDWAKNIGSAINSKVPSVPQTDIAQFGVDTKSAVPQQPTIGDFSGSVPETKGPAANNKGVITNPNNANKHENTTANIAAINRAHGQDQSQPATPVTQAVQQAAAIAQTDQAVSKSSDTGMGQGSILDSLYSKLKDTDVDYSDLAKRISQNEYDLARERKDGTTNAILGGIGAALTQAGTYQGVGDRVFKPGLGAIAGAGIMGGLKMSAASDEAIDKKQHENMASVLALKKLKGDSLNNVLDAISAQKQNEVYAQSVAQSGAHNAATTALEGQKLSQQAPLIASQIAENAARATQLNAAAQQILANKTMSDADKESLKTLLSQYNNLVSERTKIKTSVGTTPTDLKAYDDKISALETALGSYTNTDLSRVAPSNPSALDPNRVKVISREQIQ